MWMNGFNVNCSSLHSYSLRKLYETLWSGSRVGRVLLIHTLYISFEENIDEEWVWSSEQSRTHTSSTCHWDTTVIGFAFTYGTTILSGRELHVQVSLLDRNMWEGITFRTPTQHTTIERTYTIESKVQCL